MEETGHKKCNKCGRFVSEAQQVCPYCGGSSFSRKAEKQGKRLRTLIIAGIALVVLGAAAMLSPHLVFWMRGEMLDVTEPEKPEIAFYEVPREKIEEMDISAFWRQPGIWSVEYPDLTARQREAMEVIRHELSYPSGSRRGLFEKLEKENFSRQEAEEAMELCRVDWKIQALKDAYSYLSFCTYSEQRLGEQLEFEQFQPEEIEYALENCGADWVYQAEIAAQEMKAFAPYSKAVMIREMEEAGHSPENTMRAIELLELDWNEVALTCGKRYVRAMSFTHEELAAILREEGFTPEEADYAATELDLK